jgi:AraC-like DNA-binding protein
MAQKNGKQDMSLILTPENIRKEAVRLGMEDRIDGNPDEAVSTLHRLKPLSSILQGDYDLQGSRWLRGKAFLSPSSLAHRSYLYLQGLASIDFPREHFTRRSGLDSYLIALTFSGEGCLEYEGKTYNIKPGEGFLIDCRKDHYYRATGKSGWGYHIIHFDGFAAADYFLQIKNGGGVKFSADQAFDSYLDELYEVNNAAGLRAEALSSCILTNMLTAILKTLPEFEAGAIPEKILDVRRFLDEHFAEDISLDLLADRFAVSKFHLSRLFRQHIGRSPKEYLIATRLSNAKALLHFTTLTMSAIAEAVGFADNSHFYAIFRKYEGSSPAAYRRQWTGRGSEDK